MDLLMAAFLDLAYLTFTRLMFPVDSLIQFGVSVTNKELISMKD